MTQRRCLIAAREGGASRSSRRENNHSAICVWPYLVFFRRCDRLWLGVLLSTSLIPSPTGNTGDLQDYDHWIVPAQKTGSSPQRQRKNAWYLRMKVQCTGRKRESFWTSWSSSLSLAGCSCAFEDTQHVFDQPNWANTTKTWQTTSRIAVNLYEICLAARQTTFDAERNPDIACSEH